MTGFSGVTFGQILEECGLTYPKLNLEIVRYEHLIGKPVWVGHARVFSHEQAAKLKELISARRAAEAQEKAGV